MRRRPARIYQSDCAGSRDDRDKRQRLEIVVAPRGRTQHAVKCVFGGDDREHQDHAAIENAIGEDAPASEHEQRHQHVEDHARVGCDIAGGVVAFEKMKDERLEDELVAVEPVEQGAERAERECEDYCASGTGFSLCGPVFSLRGCDE